MTTNRNNTIWFVISCRTIGGAERRILNLANQSRSLLPSLRVCFLVRPQLIQNYRLDSQLAAVLDRCGFEVMFIEDDEKVADDSRIKQPEKFRFSTGALRRFTVRVLTKCGLRRAPAADGARNSESKRERLIRKSWFSYLMEFTKPGDEIHCFAGDEERNGGILASMHQRHVVVEITSNRILVNVSDHLRCLLSETVEKPRLHIQCVSKTVFGNFLKEIGESFLKSHGITVDYYRSPCLPLASSYTGREIERQNVIVFGHRFVGPKNGKLFARVVKKMVASGELNSWKVHFRGWGPEDEELRDMLTGEMNSGVVDIGWSSDLDQDLSESRIFVSIVATGSYPSQSLFQAMRNGNILLLGDAGETKERFDHPDVVFTEISESAVRSSLLEAMRIGNDKVEFERVSLAMSRFFDEFAARSTQAKELLELHFPSSATSESNTTRRH